MQSIEMLEKKKSKLSYFHHKRFSRKLKARKRVYTFSEISTELKNFCLYF